MWHYSSKVPFAHTVKKFFTFMEPESSLATSAELSSASWSQYTLSHSISLTAIFVLFSLLRLDLTREEFFEVS